eukprot:GHVU01066903.1.p1 GENE.GHVU01066903.1~~GHVU01066903.1.p1  ORF type:complete len:345 (-),score=48.09 GHVU01066903.1:32-1066(-)
MLACVYEWRAAEEEEGGACDGSDAHRRPSADARDGEEGRGRRNKELPEGDTDGDASGADHRGDGGGVDRGGSDYQDIDREDGDDGDGDGEENDGDESDSDASDSGGGTGRRAATRKTRKGIANKQWPPAEKTYTTGTLKENIAAAKMSLKYSAHGKYMYLYALKTKRKTTGSVYSCHLHTDEEGTEPKCPVRAMWRVLRGKTVSVHVHGSHAAFRVPARFGVQQEHKGTLLERKRTGRSSTAAVTRTVQFDVDTGLCGDGAPPAPSHAAVTNMLRRAKRGAFAAAREDADYASVSAWLDTHRAPKDADTYAACEPNQLLVLANKLLSGLGFVFSSPSVRIQQTN